MVPKIQLLDGCTFDFNKEYSCVEDLCVTVKSYDIAKIHQSNIDMGCKYITTSNYLYTPKKCTDWRERVLDSCLVTQKLDKRFDTIILGCLPPYFENNHNGKIDNNFLLFYNELFDILDPHVDMYIIETCVSISHVISILNIMEKKNLSKDFFFSIHPKGNIKKRDIKFL